MRRAGRVSVCIGALLAVLSAPLAPAEKASSAANGLVSPKEPSVPSAELLDQKDAGKKTDCSATIVTARGERKTGMLAIKSGSIEVSAGEGGALGKTAVAIADIDSIEITRWRGVERRKNEFAFYPVEMKIILKDKRALQCTGSVALLHRLAFRDSGGNRFVYSYFYDYWRNGAWKNSGQTGRDYPATNPLGDTLVKIIFLREEMKNPLEKLFSR